MKDKRLVNRLCGIVGVPECSQCIEGRILRA